MPAFEQLRQCLSRMSIVFLISDFYFQEDIFNELIFKQLVSKNDLIPILLNDPFEENLPQGERFSATSGPGNRSATICSSVCKEPDALQ